MITHITISDVEFVSKELFLIDIGYSPNVEMGGTPIGAVLILSIALVASISGITTFHLS